jgi:hypothetical protein
MILWVDTNQQPNDSALNPWANELSFFWAEDSLNRSQTNVILQFLMISSSSKKSVLLQIGS